MRENYNARHNHHFMEKFNSKALLVDWKQSQLWNFFHQECVTVTILSMIIFQRIEFNWKDVEKKFPLKSSLLI